MLVSLWFTLRSCRYLIASNGTMTDEQWIRKHLVGSDLGLVEVLSGHFLELLSKITENLNEDSQCPSRDSKSEYLPNTTLEPVFYFIMRFKEFNAFDVSLTTYHFPHAEFVTLFR